jgi:hypothetical protein
MPQKSDYRLESAPMGRLTNGNDFKPAPAPAVQRRGFDASGIHAPLRKAGI